MTTPILKITELANSQRHQFATANQAFRDLEAAANDFSAVDLSGGNATLTAATFSAAFLFRASGHTVDRELTVPQQKRFFAISNAGAGVVSVVRGSTSLPVGDGSAGIFYADGTPDGLVAIASGGGNGSTADVYANATVSGGVVDLSDESVSVWLVDLDQDVDTVTLPTTSDDSVLPIIVLFVQDGTGGRTVTGWTGSPVWEGGSEPSVNSGANTITSIPLLILGNGSVYGVS